MSSISIKNIDLTKLEVDAIVNAANEKLLEGGGVCGAIFYKAGSKEMNEECNKIGYCKTGDAVITPGFKLPAKYVIHAVGPIWNGGNKDEAKLLYSAYNNSLLLAKKHNIHSIGFPLISSGIYGYPIQNAWDVALKACLDFINSNLDYDIKIIFAVIDNNILEIGNECLKLISK